MAKDDKKPVVAPLAIGAAAAGAGVLAGEKVNDTMNQRLTIEEQADREWLRQHNIDPDKLAADRKDLLAAQDAAKPYDKAVTDAKANVTADQAAQGRLNADNTAFHTAQTNATTAQTAANTLETQVGKDDAAVAKDLTDLSNAHGADAIGKAQAQLYNDVQKDLKDTQAAGTAQQHADDLQGKANTAWTNWTKDATDASHLKGDQATLATAQDAAKGPDGKVTAAQATLTADQKTADQQHHVQSNLNHDLATGHSGHFGTDTLAQTYHTIVGNQGSDNPALHGHAALPNEHIAGGVELGSGAVAVGGVFTALVNAARNMGGGKGGKGR